MGKKSDLSRVVARAPGKVNVYFRVGRQHSDGYHDVASLYLAVSIYEEVTAEHSTEFTLRFTGAIDTAELPVDESNLALRAARALAAHTGYEGGVALTIDKSVPIAGGMGGGSADAAATLVACDELWGTGLGRAGLHPIAATLGADVPFALAGGAAVGTGRGDVLSQALTDGELQWVFALAEGGLLTRDVYEEFDRYRDAQPQRPQSEDAVQVDALALQALRFGDAVALAEVMHNDLQSAALRLTPDLGDLIEFGETHGALAGIVSGSGPTIAFLVDSPTAAAQLQSDLAQRGTTAIVARGPVHGARLV